jgi:TolB-like protein/tRNA A-37 threonylcarbamoyl transferase component Bud32/Flp pilus assembly protein TadD
VLGQQLGHYRILEKIGAGGMGEVYRAHDEQLDRDVALKVLPAHTLTDEIARARLLREARAAAALNHPHICTIHEVGEAGGQAYIAMELVEGKPLSALVPGQGLPVETVLRFGSQIADALAHAHERRIVHRDLKSANVVITPEGRAKVLDFGLAKRISGEELAEATTQSLASLTQAGALIGTVPYMAPEQLRGQPADARSDVWALGVMLYEMVAGARPFQGQTSFELSSAILNQVPPPLSPAVPTQLGAVIERCLAKEPGQRYQQGSEVRAALEAVHSGAAIPAWPTWKYALSRRRWLVLVAALAAVFAVLAALNFERLRTRLTGGAPRIRSLAVLPLENLSGDPEQEYFADGMTEELITNLAKISALKVISRTSMMQYKGTKKPLPQIAKELNVDAIIEGSVLREGGQVRITAQLIQASTDQHLWAESYQRDLRGVLALQGEIASVIAEKVRAALTPTERARLASARPVNPETYEAYLKAMFYMYKKTPEGFAKGLALLQEAIKKDPADPLPYAGLALAYPIIFHGPGGTIPPREGFPRARAAALKALELDESSAQAHAALAAIKFYFDWDWTGAEKEFRRALELNPNLPEAHAHYGWYLLMFGHFEEGLAEEKRAVELDPLTSIYTAWVGWMYLIPRQDDKAIAEARKALELDPNAPDALYVLGAAYGDKRMFEQAIAAHKKLATVNPDWKYGLGETYALAGRKGDALKIVAGMEREDYSKFGLFIAMIQIKLGDKEETFRSLEAAYEYHHIWLPWELQNSEFPWQSDPRFQELRRRMNFPQ